MAKKYHIVRRTAPWAQTQTNVGRLYDTYDEAYMACMALNARLRSWEHTVVAVSVFRLAKEAA